MEYGILSIIPAVLAIALAMITKNIVVSCHFRFRRLHHYLWLEPDRGLSGNDTHPHFRGVI